ncbi:MAG: hypothetical protein M5U28_43490 [Sandaracinaceae bacterium]|nr:hypothetical protein [Sandaracinaceae bacterium]
MVDAATGLAEPCSVAELLVMLVAPVVSVIGGPGTVNDCTAPKAVPEAFATMAQK